MVPEVGSRTLRIILIVVVLPAPLGPSRPTISLRRTVNETASTATVSRYTLRRSATARTWGGLVVIQKSLFCALWLVSAARSKKRPRLLAVCLRDNASRSTFRLARSEEHTSELQSLRHLVC